MKFYCIFALVIGTVSANPYYYTNGRNDGGYVQPIFMSTPDNREYMAVPVEVGRDLGYPAQIPVYREGSEPTLTPVVYYTGEYSQRPSQVNYGNYQPHQGYHSNAAVAFQQPQQPQQPYQPQPQSQQPYQPVYYANQPTTDQIYSVPSSDGSRYVVQQQSSPSRVISAGPSPPTRVQPSTIVVTPPEPPPIYVEPQRIFVQQAPNPRVHVSNPQIYYVDGDGQYAGQQ